MPAASGDEYEVPELTRFRGHLRMLKGVHDGSDAKAIFSGVAGAVGAARTVRPITEELSREFEPSEQTIRNWVKQAELDDGSRSDGLTTDERDELTRLR